MSCRHSLANNTCIDCYPLTGTFVPSPNQGPNLDGPGARTQEEYDAHIAKQRVQLLSIGITDPHQQDIILQQVRVIAAFFHDINPKLGVELDVGGIWNRARLSVATEQKPVFHSMHQQVPTPHPEEESQATWAARQTPYRPPGHALGRITLTDPGYAGGAPMPLQCGKPTTDRSTCSLDYNHAGDCKSRFCGRHINDSFCDRPPDHPGFCDADDLYEKKP